MSVPTLEELFEKLRKLLNDTEFASNRKAAERYFRMVASGEASPLLTSSNAIMAAQCVVVILEHAGQEEKGGEL